MTKGLCMESDMTPMNIMQPNVWTPNIDPTGWLMMEKFDGVRVRWTGSHMLTRSGTEILAPAWFTRGFPPIELDGELWAGHGKFETVRQVVHGQNARDERWHSINLMIFDAPLVAHGLAERLDYAAIQVQRQRQDSRNCHLLVLSPSVCQGVSHVEGDLEKCIKAGAEGLILANPEAPYMPGRVNTVLKVKPHQDAEAVVIAHHVGSQKGRVKSLAMRTPEGVRFHLSVGLTAQLRQDPPALGTTITYVYEGFTTQGLPKFPGFLRIHEEI